MVDVPDRQAKLGSAEPRRHRRAGLGGYGARYAVQTRTRNAKRSHRDCNLFAAENGLPIFDFADDNIVGGMGEVGDLRIMKVTLGG